MGERLDVPGIDRGETVEQLEDPAEIPGPIVEIGGVDPQPGEPRDTLDFGVADAH